MPPLKAHEVLTRMGIEECEECHCAVGDDWQFKDFSNKNIVVCPQCGTEIDVKEELLECTHYFDIRIIGKSTIYDEQELIDALYEFLKHKAEFKIQ